MKNQIPKQFEYQWLRNKQSREKEVEAIRKNALKDITRLGERDFFLIGLTLYWAEGSKTKLVDIANSDPIVIFTMTEWLKKFCHVVIADFRIQLHLHSGQDEKQIKAFWSKLLDVPTAQFHKTYIKKEGTGHRKNYLYRGTAKIRVCNRNMLHKILGWIEGLKTELWAVSSAGRAGDSRKGPRHRKVAVENRVNSGKAKSLLDKLILSQAERSPNSSSEGAETRG